MVSLYPVTQTLLLPVSQFKSQEYTGDITLISPVEERCIKCYVPLGPGGVPLKRS